MERRWIALLTLPVLAACAPDAPAVSAPEATSLRLATGDGAEPIPGQYIVVLRDDAPEVAAARGRSNDALRAVAERIAARRAAKVGFVYGAALRGFSAAMSEDDARAMARDPEVAYVEQDQLVHADATQNNAPWGLDRIDERTRVSGMDFTYTATGSGVTAYIIDTGINLTHSDFGGRATTGYDAVTLGGSATDCHGHGTHVAGTVGGTAYGVAKAVQLKAVRVLNCSGSGSNAGVIAGVDWVRAQLARPAVANMSLGGGASSALDNAVASAISSGVTFAVAAGNSNRDACQFSPARTASAITVGATTSTDARASYSNYGNCLDIFAPGSSIQSAWIGSNSATATISGTSMASPHVAGVVALYLHANGNTAPSAVRDALVSNATAGVVTSAGRKSPNRLLFTNY
ncbi:MAG: S8 family peptidase [Gemmatimonadota bacterium]